LVPDHAVQIWADGKLRQRSPRAERRTGGGARPSGKISVGAEGSATAAPASGGESRPGAARTRRTALSVRQDPTPSLLDAMDLDDRAGAPVFEALTSLAVSADETARAAQILSSVANQYRERLADVNPDASLTESETRRIERLALIAQARASLTKALVESQFRRVEDERHV
jgi:hypothetical protein